MVKFLCACLGLLPFHGVVQASECTLQSPHFGVITNVARNVNQYVQDRLCSDYTTGEIRNFDISQFKSPTGVEHAYAVQQLHEHEYEITINLNLFPMISTENITEKIQDNIKICMERVNTDKMLQGPNGEVIKLNVLTGADRLNLKEQWKLANLGNVNSLTAFPVETRVSIGNGRSHSHGYDKDISCPTIVHEFMHLLGLVDEYNDIKHKSHNLIGIIAYELLFPERVYDCRALGPDSSIMSNQGKAFEAFTKGDNQSLLRPAQFRSIIFPGCYRMNALLYACYSNAYRSTAKEGCFDMPAACRNPEQWLK